MAKPTRVQCPFCKQSVAWFYGTGTFARHKASARPNEWCAAGNFRAVERGAIYNAADPRFSRLVMKSTPAQPKEVQHG